MAEQDEIFVDIFDGAETSVDLNSTKEKSFIEKITSRFKGNSEEENEDEIYVDIFGDEVDESIYLDSKKRYYSYPKFLHM